MSITPCQVSGNPSFLLVTINTNSNELRNPLLKLNPITDLKLEVREDFYSVLETDGTENDSKLTQTAEGYILKPCHKGSSIMLKFRSNLENYSDIIHTVYCI